MIQNILSFLEESAEAYPRKTAFADEHTSLTYRELSDLSMRIGSVLGQKTGPRRPVPVLTEKKCIYPGRIYGHCPGRLFLYLPGCKPAGRTSEPDSGHP